MNPFFLSRFCSKASCCALADGEGHPVEAKRALMRVRFLQWGAVVLASTLLSGCETPGQSAVAGAATGAAAGALLKGSGRGALQGAAIGGVGGYVLGKYGEGERARGYASAQGAPVYAQPPAPVYVQSEPVYVPAPEPQYRRYPERHYHHSIPVGRSSGRYGYVYSPYTGSLVSVRGIPQGAEVVDPGSGRVFINPW